MVRVSLNLKVENTGGSPASEILLAFSEASATNNLALLEARTSEGNRRNRRSLEVKPKNDVGGTRLFSVSLLERLNPGDMMSVEVSYVLTRSLKPFPSEIALSDAQLVLFEDSAFVLSPYTVRRQVTHIKTPNRRIESFSRVEPTAREPLTYGPYGERPPYSVAPVVIHYENNSPFIVVEDLVREIEVSHWGSLRVREDYRVVHGGALHKGTFSRLDYQSRVSGTGPSPSIRTMVAKMPARARSIFYRDEIGNISSSRLRARARHSELEIEPRYPLLGGWRTEFTIGYTVPSGEFLFESPGGNKRYLNFSFRCPIEGAVVDRMTLRVVLPEGSYRPLAVAPFSVNQTRETSYSYLDVVGRPVVVLEKRNVVPEHDGIFQVYYEFEKVFMLVEPLLLVSAFFLVFMACLTYIRVDLSISKA